MDLGVSKSSPVLILAIDPGTTNFKIAILEAVEILDRNYNPTLVLENPHASPIVLEDFPMSHIFEQNTISTQLVYNSNGDLLKWGHEAVEFEKDDAFNPDFLVTN